MGKVDSIKIFQKKLKIQFPTGYQNWWSNYIFHFTNIDNAASILNGGYLYSRNLAVKHGLMLNDNADKTVIHDKTPVSHKDYVRFYFAAKTPTQYHNEGIKTKKELIHGAHCPVPVFFLFDFASILSINNIEFSSGNIANSGVKIYKDIEDLQELEFDKIYKDGSSRDKHETYCRHAEVLVRDSLRLDNDVLKYILVRSEAERETLLFLLDGKQRLQYADKIKVFSGDGIYFANRYFLDKVILQNDKDIEFCFSNHDTAKEFEFQINIENSQQSIIKNYKGVHKAVKLIRASLPITIIDWIKVELNIDGNLIYRGILYGYDDEIPF